MAPTIRPATAGDSHGVVACLHEAFEEYRRDYTPQGFADTTLDETTVTGRINEMQLLVAVDETGTVVGTIGGAAHGAEGHIRGMAVRRHAQGTGLAQRLLEAIEADLRGRGCTSVTLDTTEPLTRAMRFYERNGYRRTGKVGDFFGMRLIEYAKSVI